MEILILFLLMICNGLFAMAEMALVSSRKSLLQHWVNEGNYRARIALELARAPNRFLSTIQVGITLIGILAGAFGGSTVAFSLKAYLKEIPYLSQYSEIIALGVVVLGLTYLTIVIGELVPKHLALNNPERIASAIAVPLRLVSAIAHPLVQVLTYSSERVLKLLGHQPSQESPITEEEIKILIEQGTREGIFAEAEKDLVKSVFRLADREVGVLMTPRLEIVWLDVNAPFEENRTKIMMNPYSRFPVAQDDLDNLLGVVLAKDLLVQGLSGRTMDLKEKMSPALFIPENAPAMHLLELFKKSRPHLALVVDEYGGIQGLVTLNDLLESLVGEISSQDQTTEPQAVQREDGSWLVDGMMPVDEFKEIFGLGRLPDEGLGHFQTLGGFIMMQMGRVPHPSENFEWEDLHFEVVDMDGKRVDKVLITKKGSQVPGPRSEI
ncbi:MAG: HlyC/CorC family transporter [Deltaproteobacteria bacterium]|nr:HlyC/CorC family transporter [Deltaproteobacteria bacterium]